MSAIDEDAGSDRSKSSDQIEREVELTRAQVTETLDELRERMSPTNMVDQVISLAKDTGADDVLAAAGRVVKRNPLPFLVIGAGLAWLVASAARKRAPELPDDGVYGDFEGDDYEELDGGATQRVLPSDYGSGTGADGSRIGYAATGSIKRSMPKRSITHRISEAAEDAFNTVADGIDDAAEAVSERASKVRNRLRGGGRKARASAGGALEQATEFGNARARRFPQQASGASATMDETTSNEGIASRAAQAVTGAAAQVAETATNAVHAAGETVGGALHAATGAAKHYSRSAAATGDKAMSYGRETAGAALKSSRDTFSAAVDYQPALVVGALGFAIGAAIGALIPSTEAENRLMGETSDDVKSRARQLADEQVRKARDAAGRIYDEVKEDVQSQDFAGIPGDILSSVTDRVRHVADTAKTAAKDEATDLAASAKDALDESSDALAKGLQSAGGKAGEATSRAADSVVRTAEAGSRSLQDIARGADKLSSETNASTPSSATVPSSNKVS